MSVAASRDVAVIVDLARLIAPCRQPEPGADRSGPAPVTNAKLGKALAGLCGGSSRNRGARGLTAGLSACLQIPARDASRPGDPPCQAPPPSRADHRPAPRRALSEAGVVEALTRPSSGALQVMRQDPLAYAPGQCRLVGPRLG